MASDKTTRIPGCSICWGQAERDAAAFGGPVLAHYRARVEEQVDDRTHFPPDDGFFPPDDDA